MQAGGPVVLAALLSRKHTMLIRRNAASAMIGLTAESAGNQACLLEVGFIADNL